MQKRGGGGQLFGVLRGFDALAVERDVVAVQGDREIGRLLNSIVLTYKYVSTYLQRNLHNNTFKVT
jgi:hypothetical protein